MNWDLKTASGREKLIILARKLHALYNIGPDLYADTPSRFFPYMAENCVLTSDQLDRPLVGASEVKRFLIRVQRSYDGLVPIPITTPVESLDGDILFRIRPWKSNEGELVSVDLDADGLVCRMDRFSEKRVPHREIGSCVGLTPARREQVDGNIRIVQNKEEQVVISGLYFDEMSLLFLLNDDVFTDMEDRYMDTAEWETMVDRWREINESGDEKALRARLMKSQEEYIRQDRGYAQELEELISDVLEKRDPYGRRMQSMLEDWIRSIRNDYPLIRKC